MNKTRKRASVHSVTCPLQAQSLTGSPRNLRAIFRRQISTAASFMYSTQLTDLRSTYFPVYIAVAISNLISNSSGIKTPTLNEARDYRLLQ